MSRSLPLLMLATLALAVPGLPAAADEVPSSLADRLVVLYESRGLTATPEVRYQAELLEARLCHGSPCLLEPTPLRYGEIWTECDTWFEDCWFDDPAGITETCLGAIPASWDFSVWLSVPGVVYTGPGVHITWTTMHHGLTDLVGPHSASTPIGMTCFVDFFGYYLTYTFGAFTYEE